jgi:hypothetical protein
MSTLNKGRGLEQQTRDGTSSIATMGAGCTGRRNPPQTQEGRPARNTGKVRPDTAARTPCGVASVKSSLLLICYCTIFLAGA